VTTDGSGTSCTLNLTYIYDNEVNYEIRRTEDNKDRVDYYSGSQVPGEGYFDLRYAGSRDWGWSNVPVKIYAGDANGTQSHAFKYYVNWNNTFSIGSDGPVVPSGKKLETPLIETDLIDADEVVTDEVRSTGNMLINGNSEWDELDIKFSKMKFSDYDTDALKFEFNNDLGFQVRDNSALGQDKASIAIWRENGSNTENTGFIWRLHEGSGSDTNRGMSMQWQNYTGSTLNAPKQIMYYDEATRVKFEIPIQVPSYTVAEANALTSSTGDVIYCSNGNAGAKCIACFDGSSWQIVSTLSTTISAGP